MKQNELLKVIVITITYCILFISILFNYSYEHETELLNLELNKAKDKLKEEKDRIDRLEMYYMENYKDYIKKKETFDSENIKLNGFRSGNYMVIWLKDQNYMNVIETCNHEWLHYKNSKEHFTEVN